jgi:glucokinase
MRLAGAVDIGGTRTKVGIVAEDGTVLTSTTIRTSPGGEPQPLVKDIVSTLQSLLNAQREARRNVFGVGVSVAGFLDGEHGMMVGNANLPALCGFPLRRALEDGLRMDCRLEVDSNAAVVAEHRFGSGRGSRRLLGVTVGTGLGGGVIIDGVLLRHTGECAGDLGHIILDPNARRCTCGARGCLEALVCSAALAERAASRSARDVLNSAQRGEKSAVDAVGETGRWLGLGLASLSPLFAPDRIVVGGGLAAGGELLLEPARLSYRTQASAVFQNVEIVGSRFDGWEGMVGAASLVFDPLA